MVLILHDDIPDAQKAASKLPGIAPCAPKDWLRVDEAYAAQMAYRAQLLSERRDAVLFCASGALPAAQEVLTEALEVLPGLGFDVTEDAVRCPDGRQVVLDHDQPLLTLGHLVQEDICLMQKQADQHVLTGAVLCFPANWRLAEKAGRPLTDIHLPVPEYDDNIACRVQRLFDGVQVGRPLWRFNRLTYADPDLHQPRKKDDGGVGDYIRTERQCVVRMAHSGAVVFSIHTYVVRAAQTFAKV